MMERRKEQRDDNVSPIVTALANSFREQFESHLAEEVERYASLEKKIDKHRSEVDEQFSVIREKIDSMLEAFPDGDIHGHKTAHQLWIEEKRRKAEFYQKLHFELTKWGLIGFCAWAVVQLAKAFLASKGMN
jgi:uncharacterized membrane protein